MHDSRRWAVWNHFASRNIRAGIGGSGIVVGLISTVIPKRLRRGMKFMKRKDPPGESGAEQNKRAGPRALRAHSDFSIGKSRESLPEFTTV